jgi:hypothetical protein
VQVEAPDLAVFEEPLQRLTHGAKGDVVPGNFCFGKQLGLQALGPGRPDLRADPDVAALLFDASPVAVVWRDGPPTVYVRENTTTALDALDRVPPHVARGPTPRLEAHLLLMREAMSAGTDHA